MHGRTLYVKERVGFLDEDLDYRNSKGKRSDWCKAWAKQANRKIRKQNKVNILDYS